jgi:hypothetical protein
MNTFEDAHTSSKMLIMESVSTFVSIFGLVIFGGPCPMKWRSLQNLSLRPAKPALNRGSVQRRARRRLLLGPASTSQLMIWTHPRGGKRQHSRRAVRHVLERIAVRVGRAQTRGNPWIWRLKEPDR